MWLKHLTMFLCVCIDKIGNVLTNNGECSLSPPSSLQRPVPRALPPSLLLWRSVCTHLLLATCRRLLSTDGHLFYERRKVAMTCMFYIYHKRAQRWDHLNRWLVQPQIWFLLLLKIFFELLRNQQLQPQLNVSAWTFKGDAL